MAAQHTWGFNSQYGVDYDLDMLGVSAHNMELMAAKHTRALAHSIKLMAAQHIRGLVHSMELIVISTCSGL